jgi:transposase
MIYLGLDVHSKWFTLAGFNKISGEMFSEKKIANSPEAIEALFATLPKDRMGVMETGTNALSMYRLLAPYFVKLIIVAPNKVWNRKQNTSAKTDHRDAYSLAEQLAAGKLTPLFVPTDDIQDWRTLGRARIQTTQDITLYTNRIYSLARKWGYLDEKKLLTKGGRAWLDTVKLPEHTQKVLTESLSILESLQGHEVAYEQLLTQIVKDDPICQLLQTIPYVGPFTAFILRTEIGDIIRFATADNLVAYSGLTPRVFQSGDRCHYGRITKTGNSYIRYVAVLFAQNCVKGKKDTTFKRRYYRLYHYHDLNEIKIMLARDFLTVVFSMWKHNTVWRDVLNPKSSAA